MRSPRIYPDISDILARKAEGRRASASRSFGEKIETLEAMRERADLIRKSRVARESDKAGATRKPMLPDIVEATPMSGHRLAIAFADGVRGVIDVAEIVPFDGVFAPLRLEVEFARVFVNRELGSISWPCGADLDTQVLYARLCPGEPKIQAPAVPRRAPSE